MAFFFFFLKKKKTLKIPQGKLKEAQRQALYPKRHCRSVQTSTLPQLTRPKQGEKNHAMFLSHMLAPLDGARASLHHIPPSTVAARPWWGEARALQQLTSLEREKNTAQFTLQKKCSSHHCNHKALQKGSAEASTYLLVPPAVEEPASSHTSTLRNSSAKASAALCKCLFHNSRRTASRFTILCSLVWS